MHSTHPEQELGAFMGQGCLDTCRQNTIIFLSVTRFNCPVLCMLYPWMNSRLFKTTAETKGNMWGFYKNLWLDLWFQAIWLKMWILGFYPHIPCCSGGWLGYMLFCLRWWVIATKSLTETHGPSLCWYVTGAFFILKMTMHQEQQVFSRNASWGLKHRVQGKKESR